MGSPRNAARRLAALRDSVGPFARPIVALVAGIAITFSYEITTFTALIWLTVIVTVSLLMWDGPPTALNRAALWATAVVVGMAGVGLAVGQMSTATALSLSVALVAFETSRAFTRGDRIWLWSTGVLAVGLSIAYFNVDADDRTAAGLTGGWAIVAGIFGLIAAVDATVRRRRASAEAAPMSTTTARGARKPPPPATPPASTERPTPPRTKAKTRAPKR